MDATVTKSWLEKLPTLGEEAALQAVGEKGAALYSAKHGRTPATAAERTEGLRLLEAEADRIKAEAGAGVEFSLPTRAAMRQQWEQEDAAIRRSRPGW